MDIQSITSSQVRRAYIGKVGCMCGCKGKYFVSAETGAEHDQWSTVNPKKVLEALRQVQLAAATGKEVEVDPQWISFDSGGRRWCCYLAD